MANNQGRRRAWARAYRNRIENRLEHCRECGVVSSRLTWGHLVPCLVGGRIRAANVTILCHRCNWRQGLSLWGPLIPLADEPDFGEIVAGCLNHCVIPVTDREGETGIWVTPEAVLVAIEAAP
jgi:hypothetical protein